MNENRPAALARYGPLREWNTERVEDFSRAFNLRYLGGYTFSGGQGAGEDDDITGWNTSAATNMTSMFKNCNTFNQPLRFDTHNVQRMDFMFNGCTAFNQPLTFDTRAVTGMAIMFSSCTTFNQPVHFDTRNVRFMNNMFFGCRAFNQPLTFNTRACQDFGKMFFGCRAFNQPLHEWYTQPSRLYEPKTMGMFHLCNSFKSPVFAMSVEEYQVSRLPWTPLGKSALMQEALIIARSKADPAKQGRIILLASIEAARVLGAPVHDPELAARRQDADAYGYRADRHDDAEYLPRDDENNQRRVRPRHQ
jgi:hypothetical protein